MSSPGNFLCSENILHKILLSISDIDPRSIPQLSSTPDTCLSQDYCLGIFRTNKGYRDGLILDEIKDGYEVIFTHNEYGCSTYEPGKISFRDLVELSKWHDEAVEIYVSNNFAADGYIKANHGINVKSGYGSGVRGKSKKSKHYQKRYPIHNPLSLHDEQHERTLSYASELLAEAIDKDLPLTVLQQIFWMINVVLTIDGFPRLSNDVMQEAIRNFVHDYTQFPEGTQLRQPINYIFDILQIDGIWSKNKICISFV